MDILDKEVLKKQWLDALRDGTLVQSKHDPHLLDEVQERFRSVISYELADPGGMGEFIESDHYYMKGLQYANHPNPCYAILLDSSSGYSVCASGVPSWSNTPSEAFDILILAYGSGGLHIYGESSGVIRDKMGEGSIIDLGYL